MIKIGERSYTAYSTSQVNLNQSISRVCIIPTVFEYCPICGKLLKKDYKYAIQVSPNQCIRVSESACMHCDTLFSTDKGLFEKLETERWNKDAYILNLDYSASFPKLLYRKICDAKKSIYCQFSLSTKNEFRMYTIVYDKAETDGERIIHYSSEIGVALLLAAKNNDRFVEVENQKFCIVQSRRHSNVHKRIEEEIEKTITRKIYFQEEIPEFSLQHTVYIYEGNITCHKWHTVAEYCAHVQPFGQTRLLFFVEYCYDCNKFLMKYSDYQHFLKKYHFFPTKVRYHQQHMGFDGRAEKSPLALSGYTVSQNKGYSAKERQRILSYILDHHILERREVLNYLEMFIRDNRYRYEEATAKWEEDKNFVLNYELEELPMVEIVKIERR